MQRDLQANAFNSPKKVIVQSAATEALTHLDDSTRTLLQMRAPENARAIAEPYLRLCGRHGADCVRQFSEEDF